MEKEQQAEKQSKPVFERIMLENGTVIDRINCPDNSNCCKRESSIPFGMTFTATGTLDQRRRYRKFRR